MEHTPELSHLTDPERRAYILADNKLALNAGWDREILAIELQGLIDFDFDVEATGFSFAEVDFVLGAAGDGTPTQQTELRTRCRSMCHRGQSYGDLCELGRHGLICGDARRPDDYAALLDGERVDLVFTDPPYNVSINGHVSGLGEVRHREFMNRAGFVGGSNS